jgi:hypothetical protein
LLLTTALATEVVRWLAAHVWLADLTSGCGAFRTTAVGEP